MIQSECEKSIELSGGIASGMPGPDAGDASRRRHVDIRQFPVEDGGGKIRFHALASMAWPRAPGLVTDRRRLLRVIHLSAGTGHDESSLRGRLR